ncbi:MAG: hypothetical protein PHP17_03950 [Candidatus Omnitrophica bacterium]|nr:hypothetical protein [Candidatus Omnitrophota bacterium]
MVYNLDKYIRIMAAITLVIVIALAAVYLKHAQKTQRVMASRLNNQYATGAITLQKYEQLKRKNSFINALFNPA